MSKTKNNRTGFVAYNFKYWFRLSCIKCGNILLQAARATPEKFSPNMHQHSQLVFDFIC